MAKTTFGNIYWNTPANTVLGSGTPAKAAGVTALGVNAEFDMPANNQLRYIGDTDRSYQVVFAGAALKTEGGGSTAQVKAHLYKNGVAISGATIQRSVTSASDVGAFALVTQVSLSQNDYVELWVESDNGNDVQIEYGSLSAKVLG